MISISMDTRPIHEQFVLPVRDVEILKREHEFQADGEFVLHLPNMSKIDIPYENRESIDELKDRIKQITKINLDNYHLVSPFGIIPDNGDVDDIPIRPKDHILLVKRNVQQKKIDKNLKTWLKPPHVREAISYPALSTIQVPVVATKVSIKSKKPIRKVIVKPNH